MNFHSKLIITKVSLVAGLLISFSSFAKEPTGMPTPVPTKKTNFAIDCAPGTSNADLDINAVRARILQSGDMWWEPGPNGKPKYEVPKLDPPNPTNAKSPIYAGALWFGGIDGGGQLKLAAATYGHGNASVDFYPGPIDTNGTSSKANCNLWDKHYKINKSDVDSFKKYRVNSDDPNYVVPDIIKNWPGNGGPDQSKYLAPFKDANQNGIYEPVAANPLDRDYPEFQGDQAIWWVYNDVGNTHQQTQGKPIGLEVQALAFAFATSDELNTMTFYKYRIVNRAIEPLLNTYFGQWVDADLGYAFDDYVGCDAKLGLGYCYNGDEFDEGQSGYGENPPAVGVDFFKGPKGDDGKPIQMAHFTYYINKSTDAKIGDPNTAQQYYNYLQGKWKDGTRVTYGGDGYDEKSINFADFMFPGLTDDKHQEFSWTENTPGPGVSRNVPDDRRFIQSAGPFTLQPGAVNEIIVGVVFAQANSGGSTASVNNLLIADRKAQALFDKNFSNPEGPIIPDLNITELDKELILSIDNYQAVEKYVEKTLGTASIFDTLIYRFQGYIIYQLANGNVQAQDLADPDQARIVAQCDIRDQVATLINQYQPGDLSFPTNYFEKKIMVKGENKGIRHVFQVKTDLFAKGNNTLVNNKKYYFMLIPYAYSSDADDGRFEQAYLQGQKRTEITKPLQYTAIPHIPSVENGGQVITNFNNSPQIKRVDGFGNGGNELEFTDETMATVKANVVDDDRSRIQPVYKNGKGPISIRVYNPKNVPIGEFEFKFNANMAGWILTNLTTGETVVSEKDSLGAIHEQIIPKWGFSIALSKIFNPSEPDAISDQNNGYVTSSIEFSDPSNEWLRGVIVGDKEPNNWLNHDPFKDGNKIYWNVVNSTWAPFHLTSNTSYSPGDKSPVQTLISDMRNLESVNVIFTSDKSLWSRCAVIETGTVITKTEGGADKNELRKGISVDKDGNPTSGTGLGWFPGYAVSVETGERLNILFGEDSRYVESNANGRDMIWNPTNVTTLSDGTVINGGKHFVYVANTRYDECAKIYADLSAGNTSDFYKQIAWVNYPLVAPGRLLNNEATVKLRVARSFARDSIAPGINDGWPMFSFGTADIATKTNELEVAKSVLDLIKIVPNPYYAYSTYEESKVDTRVKFTNLPKACVISIYTVNGNLVKRINKDDSGSTISEWDLRNDEGIPIASGVYIINIKSYGVGEKTLKWFATMRKFDADKF